MGYSSGQRRRSDSGSREIEERPSFPAPDESCDVVAAAFGRFSKLEEDYLAAREAVGSEITDLVGGMIDRLKADREDGRLVALIRFLYWEADANVPWIKELFGIRDGEVRELAGPYVREFVCQKCNREVLVAFASRQALGPRRDPSWSFYVCDDCEESRREQTHREFQAKDDRRAAEAASRARRIAVLRSMPYTDYLWSPEWRLKRMNAIYAARGRCQLCNAGDRRLNVHHRTYERLGDEHPLDLLVLCEPCHEKFHREAQLSPR